MSNNPLKIEVDLSGHTLFVDHTGPYGVFRVRHSREYWTTTDRDEDDETPLSTYVDADQARNIAEAFTRLADELDPPQLVVASAGLDFTAPQSAEEFEDAVLQAIARARKNGRIL